MLSSAAPPTSGYPARRPELIVRPLGEQGRYVVKDPHKSTYYQLGDEEYFLLTQLDGHKAPETIRTAFAERFGQPLSDEELQDFLAMAKEQGFLLPASGERERPAAPNPRPPIPDPSPAPLGLRILYWRKNFFDPDRLFTWLAPRIWFFWTPAFLVVSACCIALATALTWAHGNELAGSFVSALRWETAILAWLALVGITLLHEAAHGLTCKRYGGEVHEIGFLLLFFMPCFYCNVSDAWLFKEKSKRLWVTFVGGYFELFLWALAVFVWRITLPGTLVNHLAFVILMACGVGTLFNFNPLLKLDGYYLLSDWLEIPNLQQRSAEYLKARLRWLLWGAARPQPEPRGRALLLYGLVSWLYTLTFLGITLVVLGHVLGTRLGLLGLALVALLAVLCLRGMFHGVAAGEVRKMFLYRHRRALVWTLILVGVPVALFLIPIEDRATGQFQVRPAIRGELRAPVAGFLKEICCDEGERVSAGMLVVQMHIPDLASRITQKSSEVREVEARLRLLETGPRYEEIIEQRRRVERAESWHELARQDLTRGRQSLTEELKRLEEQIVQYRADLNAAQESLVRANKLRQQRTLSDEEVAEADRKVKVARAQVEQAQAQKKSRQALGTQEAEAEVARRASALADARATLTLLEAGTRPEEIDAERARLARLQEEVRALEEVRTRLAVCSPVSGVMSTPRLKEKVGQYAKEGDLIALIEEPAGLEAEIALTEQEVARVEVGHVVHLKARALPYETFTARVKRIAPATKPGDVQGIVTVYCELEKDNTGLRPGMTGHARVFTGPRSVGMVLVDRTLRYIRTEFWW